MTDTPEPYADFDSELTDSINELESEIRTKLGDDAGSLLTNVLENIKATLEMYNAEILMLDERLKALDGKSLLDE